MAETRRWELAAHRRLEKGKVVGVVVLDGWGEAAPDTFNCIHVADTPTLDALKKVVTTLTRRLFDASHDDQLRARLVCVFSGACRVVRRGGG